MKIVNFDKLEAEKAALCKRFNDQKPFKFVVIEDFLVEDRASEIFVEFPSIDPTTWVDANGLHTKNKWTNPTVEGTRAEQYFNEVNSEQMLTWLSDVTGIKDILADPSFQGAGFHQTTTGGYLDVHVDFNFHDTTGYDRRLNLITYFTKSWDKDGSGFLELWDMESARMIAAVPPRFNTAVIFETNEISYHGHPKPWKSPADESRKSLSVYYYSQGRDDIKPSGKHSTLYVNTEGQFGIVKTLTNAIFDLARLGPIRRRLR